MMFQKDSTLFKISRECKFKREIDCYESFENGNSFTIIFEIGFNSKYLWCLLWKSDVFFFEQELKGKGLDQIISMQ